MVAPEFKLVDNFEDVNVVGDVSICKCVIFVNVAEVNGYDIVTMLVLPMDEGVTGTELGIFIVDGIVEVSREVGREVNAPEAVVSFLEFVNEDGKYVENCNFISVRRGSDV